MNTPYYENEEHGITIYCGDCLEVMKDIPDGSIDAVITDPPYGIAHLNKFGSRSNLYKATPYKLIINDDKPFDPSPFLEFPKVCLWGANWYADKLPNRGSWLVWDKRVGGASDNFSDGEMAWTNYGNVMRIFRHKWRGFIRDSELNEPRLHSTQKPIVLMKWCMDILDIGESDLILDPFLGSGTTAIAAYQTGRRCIGIEISEEYCEIAARRIKEAVAQKTIALEV